MRNPGAGARLRSRSTWSDGAERAERPYRYNLLGESRRPPSHRRNPEKLPPTPSWRSRLGPDLVVEVEDLAADAFGRTSKSLRMTRLRPRGDPPGTGLEPDCSFYVGERAERYRLALKEGEASADAFLEELGPDLVVEVEVTHVDKGKVDRYAALEAREFWQIRGRRGDREVAVDFFALQPDAPPRTLAASVVLQGLTPGDVREAIEPVRFSRTVTERMQAVARIVRRRREASMRVREEDPPPYSAIRQQSEGAPACPHG